VHDAFALTEHKKKRDLPVNDSFALTRVTGSLESFIQVAPARQQPFRSVLLNNSRGLLIYCGARHNSASTMGSTA